MNNKLRSIAPGETFYLHGDKIHYVGVIMDNEPIHVYWVYDKYRRRRDYTAVPEPIFEIICEYLRKIKRK